MSNRYSGRVLALAGLAQALHQVRRIAETGQSEGAAVQASLDSVFRIDAATPLAVYGRVGDVAPGLRVLRGYLAKEAQDDGLSRLAMAVLQLERRFVREDNTVHAVTRGLAEIAPRAEQQGSTHPDVLSALGGLYADTISHLRPRVMVQGNPHYLGAILGKTINFGGNPSITRWTDFDTSPPPYPRLCRLKGWQEL